MWFCFLLLVQPSLGVMRDSSVHYHGKIVGWDDPDPWSPLELANTVHTPSEVEYPAVSISCDNHTEECKLRGSIVVGPHSCGSVPVATIPPHLVPWQTHCWRAAVIPPPPTTTPLPSIGYSNDCWSIQCLVCVKGHLSEQQGNVSLVNCGSGQVFFDGIHYSFRWPRPCVPLRAPAQPDYDAEQAERNEF